MKQYLRNRVSRTASYIEIFLSILILIGIIFFAISLIRDLGFAIISIINGTFGFDFRTFIGQTIQVIIGVEFVKMLSKHTPESTVEVLMFVVARKIIVDEPQFLEMAVGVISIGLLFVIKKYWTKKTNPEGNILEGDTEIKELNIIMHTHFKKGEATNVRDIVKNEMARQGIRIALDAEVVIEDHIFKVYSVRDGDIDAVEVIPLSKYRFQWPWQRIKHQ
jgi:hypothetical protein